MHIAVIIPVLNEEEAIGEVVREIPRELAALKRSLGAATPKISLWFTVMKRNVGELLDFIRLASKMSAAQVNVQRPVCYGEGLAVPEQSLFGALTTLENDMLAEATRLAAEMGITLTASRNSTPEGSLTREEPERPRAGCQRTWTLSYVTANGNVLPGCISPWRAKDYRRLILGNVLDEPFAAIWNGER